jgi:allantoinase
LSEATIVISTVTGKIVEISDAVLPASSFPPGTVYNDYSPRILMPGLVDAHVHLNEPGRTEWEGFWHGTRAAAFGGVTTVVDMPLNAVPPTTNVSKFRAKIDAAQGQCWVDVGFHGGIIPGNAKDLKPLVQAGVRGFKGFLMDSGVEEFPPVSAEDIIKAFAELADEPTTVMFHAEKEPDVNASISQTWEPSGPSEEYQTYLDTRPASFEVTAIQEILSLAHLAPNLSLHIVHLSAMEAIPMLREARQRGVKITAETCFHYLSLAAEQIENGDTRHKCAPPIREQSNQDALWSEMLDQEDSVIKTVVSDHSPCTPDLKLLPADVPGTKSSTILWTEAMRRGLAVNETLLNVARLCSVQTALQVGLEDRKGSLQVGFDGDVAVFDDFAEFLVQKSTMLFRNTISAYQGKTLKGVVTETWVRGRRVHSSAAGFGRNARPAGELLLEARRNM